MAIARFTEAWVRGAPLGQWTDATLRGFMCQVGTTRTTWYAQALVRGGRQTRVRVGHWPDVPQADARRMAAEVLASMRRGEDPREAERARRARATTLAEAMEGHFRPGHSPRTVEGYRYNLEHYLPDWMGREVEAIGRDRAGVRARHRLIAARNGPTTADHVMRALRAVYNRARREHPDLPPNPVENVDFHARRRRRVDLSPDLLLAWGGAVLALAPVRRDLALFTLLTGMRRTAGSEARIEHLDLAGGRLRVPNPKGGEERAFDLPLSAPLRDLLAARAGARTKGWLFQSRRGGGHAFEVRFEGSGGLQGHALRHAFASIALEAGVPVAELKFLLNHSVSSLGITGDYLHLGIAHLREMQERASAACLRRVGLDHRPGQWPPTRVEAAPDGAPAASDGRAEPRLA
jgi:integrase